MENLHLEALRTITGSVRGTSHHKLYEETGFCSLKERRRRHKLILYKKIALGLCPTYLSDLLPALVSSSNPYPRRRPYERIVPKCRIELYRNSFFPSTTMLWNELPACAQTGTSISEFKRFLSSSDTCVPLYYYVGDRKEQILHCRLRLGMSDLQNDLYNRHLSVDRSCSCGFARETAEHFLLYCPNYINVRLATITSLPVEWTNIQILLFGSQVLRNEDNVNVFLSVQASIKQTRRF